jgi:MFS family permease
MSEKMGTEGLGSDPDGAYPPARQGWWLVAVFFLASVVQTLDRGIFSLVVDPVRHDLAISDVQISLLQGFSFGLFYALAGVPLGLFADRTSRKWLIVAGIVLWSAGTIYGGFTHSFATIFASRLLVGFGEATLSPCAVSMMSDMFPPARRGRAISLFLMGQAVAGGLSLVLTGMIIEAAPKGGLDWLGLHGVAAWRCVFIICGGLGFIVVALMLTVRDPVRRGLVIRTGGGLGIGDSFGYLLRNWRVFAPFYGGVAMCTMGFYAAIAWYPTYLLRDFHMRAQDVGAWMGLALIIVGLLGPGMAGLMVDRISKTGARTGKFKMLILLPLALLPGALPGFAPTAVLAVLLSTSPSLVFPMFGTTWISTLQEIVPNNVRGLSISLVALFNTILGATLGPLLIALCTEHVFRDPAKIGYSIFVVMAPALVAASVIMRVCRGALQRQLGSRGEVAAVMGA